MLKPCFNRLLVQLIAPKSDTKIILPDNNDPTFQLARWTVLAVGPDVGGLGEINLSGIVVGSVVILVPGANILGVDDEKKIGLIHDTSVVMIEAKD